MARRLLLASAHGAAASGFLPPWLVALCMVVASVGALSFAVFLCGRRSRIGDDDSPKKKPAAAPPARKPSVAAAPAKKARSAGSGSTGVDPTAMFAAALYSSAATSGCHGYGGGGGHGCGGCGGGGGGGGGGGCGGGGGGGC